METSKVAPPPALQTTAIAGSSVRIGSGAAAQHVVAVRMRVASSALVRIAEGGIGQQYAFPGLAAIQAEKLLGAASASQLLFFEPPSGTGMPTLGTMRHARHHPPVIRLRAALVSRQGCR